MDSNHLDTIVWTCASGSPRRGVLGLLAGGALALSHLENIGAKKKKLTLCLNGQTLTVKKGRKGGLLKQGATIGACPAPPPPPPLLSPPPPPPQPPITCGAGTRLCGTTCILSSQCCTTPECGAGRECQGGACVCAGGVITCGDDCCIAPATLPVIDKFCRTQGTPTCICSVRGSDVCPPGCPGHITLDLPCAAATPDLIQNSCEEVGCA